MFLFAHLGIGAQIVDPKIRLRGREIIAVLFGTLAPDLIDKSLFYLFALTPGTRSYGHTLLFWVLFWFGARAFDLSFRRRLWLLLSLGAITHLTLDLISDGLRGDKVYDTVTRVMLWPFTVVARTDGFPRYPFESLGAHLSTGLRPEIYFPEIIGFLLLVIRWRFGKHSQTPSAQENAPRAPK